MRGGCAECSRVHTDRDGPDEFGSVIAHVAHGRARPAAARCRPGTRPAAGPSSPRRVRRVATRPPTAPGAQHQRHSVVDQGQVALGRQSDHAERQQPTTAAGPQPTRCRRSTHAVGAGHEVRLVAPPVRRADATRTSRRPGPGTGAAANERANARRLGDRLGPRVDHAAAAPDASRDQAGHQPPPGDASTGPRLAARSAARSGPDRSARRCSRRTQLRHRSRPPRRRGSARSAALRVEAYRPHMPATVPRRAAGTRRDADRHEWWPCPTPRAPPCRTLDAGRPAPDGPARDAPGRPRPRPAGGRRPCGCPGPSR